MMVASAPFYVSSEGDVLDEIVAAHYGDTLDGKVEAVLSANPGLASYGAVLPALVRFSLPLIDTETQTGTVQLWG